MHAYICQQLLSWWYPDQQYTIMDFIVSRYVVIWAHILPRDINQRLSDIDQAYVCMRLISLDMGPYNHKLTIQWSPIAAQLWLSRNLFSQKRWGIVYLWSKNKLQFFKLFNASIMSSSYLYFNNHYHHDIIFNTVISFEKFCTLNKIEMLMQMLLHSFLRCHLPFDDAQSEQTVGYHK